ncbi:colorectal mutant cancer protein [Notolabrus celidotus]|uniref:colorectal mutant cancer protein n=1 Tax=Notolabrus celidotus TaxID=1203425 RepID=UPI00148F8040|nr:colorectal mutant cancer protein [Notolabrus celidotus]
MEDPGLIRCDSLDTGTGSDWEVMTPMDRMTFDPEGSEPAENLDPSPAELAQCEAEVGTLLSIIAELNKKMGSLKAPSESGDLRPPGPPGPLVPDLLSHRLTRSSPERTTASANTSKPLLSGRGGGSVMWTKLQEVLSSVEDSISCKRSWAAPITALDQSKHREHLRAAQESWGKSAQILEDMEKEFGISCPQGAPKDKFQEEIPDQEKRDSALKGVLLDHQEELERAQSIFSNMEEEKSKLVGLHKPWRSGSHSPSYRPPSGALSPDWASPPFPGSPLLSRRTSRAVTPLSLGGDGSPLGSVRSYSPCQSPISPESEPERLHRCIERLKARNERLTAALERRKAESEQISAKVNKLEADCCALQTALRYSEECEEAYSELLSIYDSKKQQSIPDSAEKVGDRPDSPSAQLREMGTEELSTSFSTAGVTEEMQTQRHTGQRTPEQGEPEAVLRQQIERLKRDRAAICLPKSSQGDECKMSPDTGHPAGSRGGPVTKESAKPSDTKKEKASLFYELISVREEMSDLRALIRLKEKELRCLEWSLMAQKAQEAAGAFVPESLREELEDHTAEQQRFCESAAKLGSEGDIPSPRSRPILKELQAVLQREQALKKRLALVHDSLNTALSDNTSHRRDSGEQYARLTQAHSKALSSYRQIRRKYREQVWRLEQKVAAMMESHQQQSAAQKSAGESSEWRREETVL